MREIKFRAWDKKNNEWLFGYELPSLGGFSLMGEVMMMGEWSALLSNRFPDDVKEIAAMQYTGLKDKNGKEIYEHDIVKAGGGIYLVNWEKTGASFRLKNVPEDSESMMNYDDTEIIGNIYENPDLLPSSSRAKPQ